MAVTSKLYRGSSADERREQRRAQLIAAAVSVYGERGYHNVSVKAVCAKAGLTERYFYESFANGAAMLVAAFDAVTDFIENEVLRAGQAIPVPGVDRMRAMLEAYFGTLRSDHNAARVFLVEIGGVSSEVDQVLQRALSRGSARLDFAWGLEPALQGDTLLKAGITGGLIQLAVVWVKGDYAEPIQDVVDAGLQLTRVVAPPC